MQVSKYAVLLHKKRPKSSLKMYSNWSGGSFAAALEPFALVDKELDGRVK